MYENDSVGCCQSKPFDIGHGRRTTHLAFDFDHKLVERFIQRNKNVHKQRGAYQLDLGPIADVKWISDRKCNFRHWTTFGPLNGASACSWSSEMATMRRPLRWQWSSTKCDVTRNFPMPNASTRKQSEEFFYDVHSLQVNNHEPNHFFSIASETNDEHVKQVRGRDMIRCLVLRVIYYTCMFFRSA